MNLYVIIFEVLKQVLRLQLLLLLERNLVLDLLHTVLLFGADRLLKFGHLVEVGDRRCAVGGRWLDHHSILIESDHSKVAIGVRTSANLFEKARLHHFRI